MTPDLSYHWDGGYYWDGGRDYSARIINEMNKLKKKHMADRSN